MGHWYSKVGSAPFYASVERSLERLQTDAATLKAQTVERQRRRVKISSTILWYSCLIFAALFLHALWVAKQPAGKYSTRGHFLRVAPVFGWPPLAWTLHGIVMWLTGWKARRDAARLAGVQARMQKMLADLKDSTHYERTQQILRKYDPEYAKAQAREREVARREVAQAARPPSTPSHALVGLRSPRLGSVVGSSLVGAGRGIMPALDYLAATVIGDNPVLTAALQEARSEAEALRQRLASAEAHAECLQRETQGLRARLGDAEEPTSPVGVAVLSPAGPLLLTDGSERQSAEQQEGGPGERPAEAQESLGQLSAQESVSVPAQHSDVLAGLTGGQQASVQSEASRTPVEGPEDSAAGGAGKDVKED